MGIFRRFFQNFLEFFYNFLENFCNFFGKFLQFFWKILQFSAIFGKFFRKFSPTIRYGSAGVSPYCKFTRKFTSKFTPILIKILQSTKFEGSHFHNLLQLLNHFFNRQRTFQALLPAFSFLRSFLLATAFSRPWLCRSKDPNGRSSPCDGGGMWAIRGIISRITSLIVSRLTS